MVSRRPRHRRAPRSEPGSAPLLAGLVTAALLAAACSGPPAPSVDEVDPSPSASAAAAAVTEEGLRARLEELAAATEGSVGYRSVGTEGYDRASSLVEEHLAVAGWTVEPDVDAAWAFVDDGSVLEVGARRYGSEDVRSLVFSPAGAATGAAAVLDAAPGTPGGSGVGCRSTDYADLPVDAVVLVPPGGCPRRDQVLAAQQAGVAGFATYSPDVPTGVTLRPTLIRPDGLEIPAVWLSAGAANAVRAAAEQDGTARLTTRTRTEQVTTRSVLAELPGSRPDAVVMLGAHLDSVVDGPGVNDDGSGVAALLELASVLGGTSHEATVRLAFWSGEELGLQGSVRYATGLSPAERESLLVYANADMIASSNGFAGVYEEPAAPTGSAVASELLRTAVDRAGGRPVGVDLYGASDHYAFSLVDVPTTGVFSGGLEPVTDEQAAASGATAGKPADRCYHQACDDLDNVDLGLARTLAASLTEFTVRVADDPELLGGAEAS